MIILPVNFYVPLDIELGIAAGNLVRNGGVVRDLAGQIVTFLEEVPLGDSKTADDAVRVARSRNGLVVAGSCLAVVIAGGGTLIWLRRRRRTSASSAAVLCIRQYNTTLEAYLTALENRTLNEAVLDRLIAALDALSDLTRQDSVKLVLSPGELRKIVACVADYTQLLATANEVSVTGIAVAEANEANEVVALRDHLVVQRRIFDQVA